LSPAPDVTIILPAYNEERTLAQILSRLLALDLNKEVIVVDDASTDSTDAIIRSFGDTVIHITQPHNQGKGAAIRTALAAARGDVSIIQDADLEYSPEQIPSLVAPIIAKECDVVYGTRFAHGMHPRMALPNKLVNKLLAWAVRLLYFRKITDEATCYKAVRTDVLRRMHLQCNRFEFCPEVTAKAIRMGLEIREIPIDYEPRSKGAGKKIRWTDAVEAFWTLLRHRFSRF
jgi:glycosyltransferase involved in cell wall biosynthesis